MIYRTEESPIDFQQVNTFIIVARLRNFTRAASQLHVSQSTITLRIRALEDELGCALFHRDSRHVTLTDAGELFLPYAERIIELVEESRSRVNLEGKFHDRIVIGSLNSLWDYLLHPIVQEFRSHFSHATIRLITGHSTDIARQLADGLIDSGIVYTPPQTPEFEVECLGEFPIVFVTSPDIECNERTTLDELANLPIVYLDWGPPFSEWYAKHVATMLAPVIQVDHATIFMKYLLGGSAAGFAPDFVVGPFVSSGRLRQVTLANEVHVPYRSIYHVVPKKKTKEPIVRHWCQHLHEYFHTGLPPTR